MEKKIVINSSKSKLNKNQQSNKWKKKKISRHNNLINQTRKIERHHNVSKLIDHHSYTTYNNLVTIYTHIIHHGFLFSITIFLFDNFLDKFVYQTLWNVCYCHLNELFQLFSIQLKYNKIKTTHNGLFHL